VPGLQRSDERRAQIDGVVSRGNRRQQRPVGGFDAHYVVQARVVAVGLLSQQEVRAFAGMAWNHIADDNGAMVSCAVHEALVLLLGAEVRIDVETDAIEVAVDGGCVGATVYAA